MVTRTPRSRYLLLPPRGLQLHGMPMGAHLDSMFRGLSPAAAHLPGAMAQSSLRVVDSVHENGLKLVEMSADDLLVMREAAPGIRVVPEVFFQLARMPWLELRQTALAKNGKALAALNLKLVYRQGGKLKPVAGAEVVAFTDFAARVGAQARSRANGALSLPLGAKPKIERLYVYPRFKVWPLLLHGETLRDAQVLELRPLDFSVPDLLAQLRAIAGGGDGQGVTVGVVDTGCGPHPDLKVTGGQNLVIGQDKADYADNGDQHGTHVAGIIKALPSQVAQGMEGLAPGVTLRAYRVFAKGKGASNYSIAKAIDTAVAEGCDLINLSLGGAELDPAVGSAIADAREAGSVVICATGNDGASRVSFPAADARAIAVGCFGKHGSFPSDSVSADAVAPLPPPLEPGYFMASFSNHGHEVDFAGPGVGIVSTVPGGAWAVMDGTSMACPALTAMLARWLSQDTPMLAQPRDQARSDAIIQLAFSRASPLGFGPNYEGKGWIR